MDNFADKSLLRVINAVFPVDNFCATLREKAILHYKKTAFCEKCTKDLKVKCKSSNLKISKT